MKSVAVPAPARGQDYTTRLSVRNRSALRAGDEMRRATAIVRYITGGEGRARAARVGDVRGDDPRADHRAPGCAAAAWANHRLSNTRTREESDKEMASRGCPRRHFGRSDLGGGGSHLGGGGERR